MKLKTTLTVSFVALSSGFLVGCSDQRLTDSRSPLADQNIERAETESGANHELKRVEADQVSFGIRNGTLNGTSVYGGDFMAVGRLFSVPSNQTICTATLVTARVILTARHCLPPNGSTANLQFSIYNSGSASGDALSVIGGYEIAAKINNKEVTLDAVALTLKSPYDYNPYGVVNGPQQAFKGIIGFNGQRLTANAAVTVIGFGVTPNEATGTRRVAPMKVAKSPYGIFADGTASLSVVPTATNSVVCPGDSGGPLLVQRTNLVSGDVPFSGLNSVAIKSKFVIAGIANSVLGVAAVERSQWCAKATGARYIPFDRYKNEIGGAIAAADRLRY